MAKRTQRTAASLKTRIRAAKPRRAHKTATERFKRFNAAAWCGIFPNLAGDTVRIQRSMRDE